MLRHTRGLFTRAEIYPVTYMYIPTDMALYYVRAYRIRVKMGPVNGQKLVKCEHFFRLLPLQPKK